MLVQWIHFSWDLFIIDKIKMSVSNDLLSCIFHYLPVQQAKDWALLGDTFYRASRLGSAMNMRWEVHDNERLNALLSRFFVHLVQAVEVSELTMLTCFHYARVKITDVKFIGKNICLSRKEYINFDNLTTLSIHNTGHNPESKITELPNGLKCLKFVGDNGKIVFSCELPKSLEILHMNGFFIDGDLILPEGLKTFKYIHTQCYEHLPKNLPINLQYLHIQGKSASSNRWRIGAENTVYPFLTTIVVIDRNLKDNIDYNTLYYPSLKHLEVTKLRLKNDGGLYIDEFETYDGEKSLVIFTEERNLKKIKN